MRSGTVAARIGIALSALLPGVAWAQVPVIDSSSSDAPPAATTPAPPPAPAAPLDLQQPGAPAPTPPPAPAPAGSGVDTVFLKDGSTIKGHIVKQSYGSFVTIQSAAGVMTITWDQVDRVVAAGAGDQVVDSSKMTGGLEGNGVGVGISGERVVKLHDPTNHFWQVGIDGGFMYGTSIGSSTTGISIYGGGADLNVMYRVGGDMPGTGGGSWSAFGLNLSAGIFGAAAVVQTPTIDGYGGGSNASGFLLVNGGVGAGYQFLTFGKMADDDLKQHGFGLFLGGKVGVANTQVFASQGGQGSSTTNAQYGPEIDLTFPEYNFGTTKRAAFYISGFLLPTGDFLFFNIQFGGSFN
jgi:hypothetical protein